MVLTAFVVLSLNIVVCCPCSNLVRRSQEEIIKYFNGFIVEKKERGISNRRNRIAVWLILNVISILPLILDFDLIYTEHKGKPRQCTPLLLPRPSPPPQLLMEVRLYCPSHLIQASPQLLAMLDCSWSLGRE